ncbi:hypothetical protein KKF25_02115, partial [Patescibacteria group bacterium]|nr:hypothetical protein [Patescibacteria group bacterium]
NWLLQVSGTRPSLALSDSSAGANLKHWLFSSMGGNMYVGTSTDSYATSSPSALTILNNGNVGVGTSSPFKKLSVSGALYVTSASTFASDLQVDGALNATGNFSVNTTKLTVDSATGNIYGAGGVGVGISTTTAGVLQTSGMGYFGGALYTGGSLYVTATTTLNGALAISGAATSTGNLGTQGNFYALGNIQTSGVFYASAGSAALPSYTFGADPNTGLFSAAADKLAFTTNGSERMRIDDAGNFGIGTTSPYSLLSISNSVSAAANTPLFTIASTTAGTATSTLFTVLASGNVGVGTALPVQPLTVIGHCVTGDTKLRRRRKKKGKKDCHTGLDPVSSLDSRLQFTPHLMRGGNDKAEDDDYIYDEVQIKDVQPGDEIASLDEATGQIVWSRVNGLLDMGTKEIYKLTTASGKTIRTTAEHPYLARTNLFRSDLNSRPTQKLLRFEIDQSVRIEELAKDTIIGIANKEISFALRISRHLKRQLKEMFRQAGQPKYFAPKVFAATIVAGLMKMKNSGLRFDDIYIDFEYPAYEKNISDFIALFFPNLNIYFGSIGRKSPAHFAAYGVYINKKTADGAVGLPEILGLLKNDPRTVTPPDKSRTIRSPQESLYKSIADQKNLSRGDEGKWTKVIYLREGMEIAVADFDSGFSLLQREAGRDLNPPQPSFKKEGEVFDVKFEKITKIEILPPEQVYDIEVEGTHNFIGNDIVAHNTYISGNLGIGTSSPLTKLSIQGAAGAQDVLNVASSTGASLLYVNASGNVGIGTAGPVQKLHVEGQCVTGDTELAIVEDNAPHPPLNLRGGEGELKLKTLRIDQIKGGEYVMSLNEKTGKLVPAKIKGLLDMGVKPVFRLTTESGKQIRTTGNHPYLTRNGWQKVAGLSQGIEIAVPKDLLGFGLRSIEKSHREDRQSHYKSNDVNESFLHNKLALAFFNNDVADNSHNSYNNVSNDQIIHKIYNFSNFDTITAKTKNPIENREPRIKVNKLTCPGNPGIKNPTAAEANINLDKSAKYLETISNCDLDNSIYFQYTNLPTDVKWEKITSIEYVGEEQVYDIEVEGTHNFVANGIIAHNTYISGNVGIGTTTPWGKLSVTQTGTAGAPSFIVEDSASPDTTPFIIDQTGNVG